MMAWLDIDFREAMSELRLAREGVSPNEGFKQQLKRWEGSSERLELVKLFALEREAQGHLKELHEGDVRCLKERREREEQKQIN